MSVPDLTGTSRAAVRKWWFAAPPRRGSSRVIDADALEARALFHELDHLDGLLFVDRVVSPRTDLFCRKRYR
jgi:peptide deformylase